MMINACARPQTFELPELPPEVATLLLLITPGPTVEVLGLESKALPLSLPEEVEVHLIGYQTPLASLGWRPGRLEPPADGGGVPLPASPWVWSVGPETTALAFAELPEVVKQVTLPGQELRPCSSGGRCYEDEVGFCVACKAREPPARPALPTPPELAPCRSGDRFADYRCLETGVIYAPDPGCLGLDTPSGCHLPTPCGFEPYQLGPQAWWVAGSSTLPAGAVGQADLDQALLLASAEAAPVTIYLGRGEFRATRPLPAGVKLRGRCPTETVLRGPVSGGDAELSRMEWLDSSTVAAGERYTLDEVNIGGPLVIDGQLTLNNGVLRAPVKIQGRLEVSTGRAEGRLTVGAGASLHANDLRLVSGADLRVEGGTVSLERTHFAPARPVIALSPGSKLSGRQLIVQGNLQIDTRASDVELSLEDVVIRVPAGPSQGAVWADVDPYERLGQELGECARRLLGRIQLKRVLVHEVSASLDLYQPDGLRLNCSQVEIEDLLIDGFGAEEALYLGLVNGPVTRVLVTNGGIFGADQARALSREALQPWSGPGVRVRTPTFLTVSPAQGISLSDLTAYARKRGLYVQGILPVEIDRVQVVRARGGGIVVQDREAPATLRDLEAEFTAYDGDSSSFLGGHGLALFAEPPAVAEPVRFERFLSHHNETAGLFLEGPLEPSLFVSGELSDNRVGIEDLNGRDLSTWLRGVELKANQLPFGSSVE